MCDFLFNHSRRSIEWQGFEDIVHVNVLIFISNGSNAQALFIRDDWVEDVKIYYHKLCANTKRMRAVIIKWFIL